MEGAPLILVTPYNLFLKVYPVSLSSAPPSLHKLPQTELFPFLGNIVAAHTLAPPSAIVTAFLKAF